jgi:hypothetical protein
MSDTSTTGLLLDGVFASEAIDSSGEILSIKGLDITDFDEGKGLANYEHQEEVEDEESKKKDKRPHGEEIVGKVVYAKKIYNEDDCTNDRERLFWKRTKLPLLYGVVRLYDAAGHDGAKALAASVRDSVANEEPIMVGFSIEGTTLDKKGNTLKETIARKVALTTKPCNKQAVSGILADPHAPDGFSKNPERAKTYFKSQDPLRQRLGGSFEEYTVDMLKAMTAGSYNTSPGSLTGGAALQVEDRTLKSMALAAKRDWDKSGKFKDYLKSVLEKANLGDVSEEFLNHYSDMVEASHYRVKKSEEVIAELKKAGKAIKTAPVKASKDSQDGKKSIAPVDPVAPHVKPPVAPAKAPKKPFVPNVSDQTVNDLKAKHGYNTPQEKSFVDKIVMKIHHAKAGTATGAGSKGGSPGSLLKPLTNNGVPVKQNKGLQAVHFDENTGTLHMPQGSFKIYIPSHDTPEMAAKFHQILSDPKVEQFHGYAMENWAKAHKLLKAGQLPPEVAMHGVLFSNLSPNTPVPMQEMMYGHLNDSMKATGQNPLTENWPNVKQDWLDRDQPQKFPDHSPEHWKRLEGALRLKHNSKTTGRSKGDVGSFMLANDKFDNMTKYKDMHVKLQDLLQRHKGNARGAAAEMMYHKNEQTKWNGRRRISIAKGKADPGAYPGMSIAGLAPKTSRYALAMMGGGNVHVPDTHFTRNLFGLNRRQDKHSIEALKNVMWEPRNTHILEGIDRYYAKNHDAVKHMLNHPKWGSVFEHPEDAVFPAFWKHWMAIIPHEQARGHKVNGYNELTDHKPFWEAIAPYMKKSESEPGSMAMQTAKQHAEWQLQYGEMPAQMMYYRHLLPQLLGAAAQREAPALVRKAQELQVDVLAKADGDTGALQRQALRNAEGSSITPKPEHVVFRNRKVKPGKAVVQERNNVNGFHLVGHDAEHLFGISDKLDHSQGWTDTDLVKIPRTHEGLSVVHYPQSVDEPNVVNADIHGVHGFVNHPESRQLAHGFDFGTKHKDSDSGAFRSDSFWAKDPTGKHAYVKGATNLFRNNSEGPWNSARKEGVYHNVGKDFFGMGKYLPAVAVVRHPLTGREHAIIQHVNGYHEHDIDESDAKNALITMNQNGDLHKAAAMNVIMGNNDRHAGNYMYSRSSEEGPIDKLTLIDHNIFGQGDGTVMDPSYLSRVNDDSLPDGTDIMKPMHPEAQAWLQKLDPGELRNQLMKYSMPPEGIEEAVTRLTRLQKDVAVSPFHTALHNSALPDGVTFFPGNNTREPSQSSYNSSEDLDY